MAFFRSDPIVYGTSVARKTGRFRTAHRAGGVLADRDSVHDMRTAMMVSEKDGSEGTVSTV